jgi:hypothetical protein
MVGEGNENGEEESKKEERDLSGCGRLASRATKDEVAMAPMLIRVLYLGYMQPESTQKISLLQKV